MANRSQTIVKKVTLGIPIRRVTGAQAQGINALNDVDISGLIDKGILQYNESRGKWEVTLQPTQLQLVAGTF